MTQLQQQTKAPGYVQVGSSMLIKNAVFIISIDIYDLPLANIKACNLASFKVKEFDSLIDASPKNTNIIKR